MNGIINQMADHVVNGRDQDPLSAGGLNGVEYECLTAILDDVEGKRPRVELAVEPEDAGQESPTPRGPGAERSGCAFDAVFQVQLDFHQSGFIPVPQEAGIQSPAES